MSTNIPVDDSTWKYEAQSLSYKSIHDYTSASSGSKIRFQQFLLLRIVWRVYKTENFAGKENSWINPDYLETARKFLSSDPVKTPWENFLQATSYSAARLIDEAYVGLGTFSLVRYHQLKSQGVDPDSNGTVKVDFTPVAMRTRAQTNKRAQTPPSPSPAPTTPPGRIVPKLAEEMEVMDISDSSSSSSTRTRHEDRGSPFVAADPKSVQDEQIVNTALIEFLNSLAIHCRKLKADWTLHRRSFVAKNRNGSKTYEARIDGYLNKRQDNAPLVILEVKPCERYQNNVRIRMQESAQMAAWISQYPPRNLEQIRAGNLKARRLLISQDRHQIYLTFAEFGADYVDYIRHLANAKDVRDVPPLVMSECGPFTVTERGHMKMLGELILGFALQACDDNSYMGEG